jgi:hypothetical protein
MEIRDYYMGKCIIYGMINFVTKSEANMNWIKEIKMMLTVVENGDKIKFLTKEHGTIV